MKGINTFTLKIIAVIAMLIDHVGAVLLPQYFVVRIIGRLAFPIYAYTLTEGFVHTRNVKKYILRLGILALVSELPFDLAFFRTPITLGHQNVFFTLTLGILMLYFLEKAPNVILKMIAVVGMMGISNFLNTDYSSMGLLMILWFYLYREKKIIKSVGVAFINVILMGGVQGYAALALIPIALHNGKQGPKSKLFFYGFYPVHLAVIFIISMIL